MDQEGTAMISTAVFDRLVALGRRRGALQSDDIRQAGTSLIGPKRPFETTAGDIVIAVPLDRIGYCNSRNSTHMINNAYCIDSVLHD